MWSHGCSEQCFFSFSTEKMYCKTEAHSSPPSNISAVWMYYPVVRSWTWSNVFILFSWQRRGAILCVKYLLIHGLGLSLHLWWMSRLQHFTNYKFAPCSWDMHTAWSSLIIAISLFNVFCKFGSNWNVHWIKPMAHRSVSEQCSPMTFELSMLISLNDQEMYACILHISFGLQCASDE